MASKRGLGARGSAQSSGERRYSDGAEPESAPCAAAGLRRRFRPPREPRRVFFFGFGCSPSSLVAGGASASGVSPRPSDGSGRWILGASGSPFDSAAGGSAGASPLASAVAPDGFFLRRRPPREPR